MSEVAPYGEEYRSDDWPHGLMCAHCDRVFGEGDRYASQWEGFQDEIPILLVVCLECALNPSEDAA